MTWLPVIREDEASGLMKQVYDRERKRYGRHSNSALAQSLIPEIADVSLDLTWVTRGNARDQDSSTFETGVTNIEREMIATLVSALNQCDY